jgi:hypothetical protein
MNRYFGVGLFVLAIFMQTPDCGTAMLGATNLGPPLESSADPQVKAAGESSKKTDKYSQASDNAAAAIKTANLDKGATMDFAQIDEAIKLNPGSYELRMQRAAMAIAAGKDGEAELSAGEAFDLSLRVGKPEDASDNYIDDYLRTLQKVKDASSDKAVLQRLQKSICEQYTLALKGAQGPRKSQFQSAFDSQCK